MDLHRRIYKTFLLSFNLRKFYIDLWYGIMQTEVNISIKNMQQNEWSLVTFKILQSPVSMNWKKQGKLKHKW